MKKTLRLALGMAVLGASLYGAVPGHVEEQSLVLKGIPATAATAMSTSEMAAIKGKMIPAAWMKFIGVKNLGNGYWEAYLSNGPYHGIANPEALEQFKDLAELQS